MYEISSVAGLGFLICCAGADIKYRKIPILWLGIGSTAVVINIFITIERNMFLIIGGAAVGIVFLLISKWTRESFGYGDSWMILLLGIHLGLWELLSLLGMAFFLSGLAAMISLKWRKGSKKQTLPFIPFLTAAYVGVILMR